MALRLDLLLMAFIVGALVEWLSEIFLSVPHIPANE
jgi:hypothetical protein